MAYSVSMTINYKDGRERDERLRYDSLDALETDLHKFLSNIKVSSLTLSIVREKHKLQEIDIDSFDKFF